MSVITQKNMYDAVVSRVMALYIAGKQMFTVYQIWKDTNNLSQGKLPYDYVRHVVESQINDNGSKVLGWTRSLGYHLTNLDNNVGRVGSAPQIYHPVGADITQYDPSFRLYSSSANTQKTVSPNPVSNIVPGWKNKKKIVKTNGLFVFNVWLNGKLVPCNLRNPRGAGGKFLPSNPFEGHGVLNDGTSVLVKQDHEGKLYAVVTN